MPKTKRKRHPNSDLAWNRTHLWGRLNLVSSIMHNFPKRFLGREPRLNDDLEKVRAKTICKMGESHNRIIAELDNLRHFYAEYLKLTPIKKD